MRDLSHATDAIDDPADLSPLIGELLDSLRALAQITDQLAHAHMRHRGRARTDDGDAALGAREADGTGWALVRARELIHAAEGAADLASQTAGRIAWVPAEQSERWLNVVFLRGADAEVTLDIFERSGAPAAIRHLTQWDYGDETTEAALVNGYVYEGIPVCPTDRAAEDRASGYALIHNPTLSYVSLLRRFPRDMDDEDRSPRPREIPAPLPRVRTFPAAVESPRAGKTAVRSVAL